MSKTPLIYLAPFQGITGSVYREVYTKHFFGIDKLFTPFFTSVHSHKSIEAKIGELSNVYHNRVPVVPQVLSNDADEIIRFNKICQDLGFSEVNWNLGCPFPRVAAKKRGSGLLPFPDMVNEILDKVMSESSIKFSIKCRLGYYSSDEIFEMLKVFNNFPLSELIIHARIGTQIYKGGVDLQTFSRVNTDAKPTLVYNGDVFTVDDYQTIHQKFENINHWMIGRGLLIDPFLPADIKSSKEILNSDERKARIRKFVDDLYYQYRKKLNDRLHAIGLMKELWEYMSYSFEKPGKVFGTVKKTKSFDEYEDAVNSIFSEREWLGANARLFNAEEF